MKYLITFSAWIYLFAYVFYFIYEPLKRLGQPYRCIIGLTETKIATVSDLLAIAALALMPFLIGFLYRDSMKGK